MARDAFCPHCDRNVQLENEAEPICPVCFSPLIEQPDFEATDRIDLDKVTDRLHTTLRLYSQDNHVDVDAAAARLIELARGNRAALDQTHKRAVTRAGNTPRDAVAGRALEITRRAVERAGAC